MNNKKKLDNETSESVDGSLQTKSFIEIYKEIETKLTKIPYSFFSSSKCVKIVRLAIQQNPINLKLSKNQKERINRKLHFFLNSFSVDQIDIFSEFL